VLIYAGIDEAGYGPMFGPLVIARSVFQIDDADPKANPPDLWQLLSHGICLSGRDKQKRIAVNDSKKLYTPASGLKHLERSVLTFCRLLGHQPANLDQLLEAIGLNPSESTAPSWYSAEPDDGLPRTISDGELSIATAMLGRTCDASAIHLTDLSAAVLFEDRFNQMVAATRSKARTAWTFVSQHLWWVWQNHGTSRPCVVVDRQGGRTNYLPSLRLIFEGASLRQTEQTEACSAYEVSDGDRTMHIRFQTKGDSIHLPIALASMTAKFLRELCMARFNAFWRQHDPALKPTAGYVQDGRRFLAEIEPLIDRLQIPRAQLIRAR
jgi:ribonuclease HII